MRAELGIFRRVQAAVLIAVAGAFATVDLGMQHAHAESVVPLRGASERVRLGLSKSLVVDLPADAFDILVSNPRIADAITRTSRRIYLFGKQVGETNIFVFGRNGEQIASFDVAVERDVQDLEAYLKRFLPNSSISVELINDNVVLTGTVQTPMDAARAVQLAQAFVTGGEATTGAYSQTATAPTDGGGVAISNPDGQRRQSAIVNMLQVIGEDQVTLKVTVAEVSRNVMKQLGVNMIGSGSADNISWGLITESAFGLGKPLSNTMGAVSGRLLTSYFNAMEQAGVMRTLAEPTLTAVSGEKATFKVGGEFNLVTKVSNARSRDNLDGATQYELEKIEYGIGLEFQPVVLSPGRISLKVRTSVSEPATEGSVMMEGSARDPRSSGYFGASWGTNLISIRKRLADTTVELPSGGSMMIAGLVRDDVRQVLNGVPGLSKVPVLGALFRSRDFVRNETELVIIITPYLSKPVARNELSKPDDNFNVPDDTNGMFLGRVNKIYGNRQAKLPEGRYHGVVGYIYK
ncbi:type II and III secretion system protein family protein [Chelativorans composti]|uniref:Type II and III secretion system protein family protein n=1 Tax=Chelativorans composti TaxID=768533 RepID=A0ABW5DFV9_9HYPH